MKIAYFVNNPLLKRDIDLYGVEYFSNRGVVVEFFILFNIVSPKVFHKKDSDYKFQEYFRSWFDLYRRLYKLDREDYVFISDSPLSSQSFMLYVIFTLLNIEYYFVDNWYVPASSNTNRRDSSKRINVINIIPKIIKVVKYYSTLSFFRYFLKKPKTVFYSVQESIYSKQITGKRSTIIPYCSFNYDAYLNAALSKESSIMLIKPYFIFIDQYLSNHPDFHKHKKRPPVTEKYYASLNSFCKRLSDYSGCEYIVASHPRRPSEESKSFDTQYVFDYKSAFMIKDCDFVVAHYSMAIDFAVLFEKPVLLITTDEIEESWVNKFIISLSMNLNTKIINIDKPFDSGVIESVLQTDFQERKKIYDNFKLKHILYDGANVFRTYEIIYKEIVREKIYKP
jgi:hypothetical protein